MSYQCEDILNKYSSEIELLLEKALPSISGHFNTFIIKAICNSTREKLDLTIFQKDKHKSNIKSTTLISDVYFDEPTIKNLLNSIDSFKERKMEFNEKLEQARDIEKLKKAAIKGAPAYLLSGAHETFFSIYQSTNELYYFKELKDSGMSREELKQIYINNTIAKERNAFIAYFTTGYDIDYSQYEGIVEDRIQSFSINININKIKPLLQILLKQFYTRKQVFLFSEAVEVDGDNIILGISIDETFYNTHRDVFHQENDYLPDSYMSFILQIINVTLEKWITNLQHNLFYTTSEYIMNNNATLQLAARDVTEGRGLPSYSYFNLLSSMSYESSPCYGKIAFLQEKTNYLSSIRFDSPIQFSDDNMRYIRKLLEIAIGEYYLLCLQDNIIGIAKIRDHEKMHIIKFDGFMKWTLEYNKTQLVSYNKEQFFFNIDTYKRQIENIVQSNKVKSLLRKLCEQRHGTMIIVFKSTYDAQKETKRLSSFQRGIQLKFPYDLSTDNEVALMLSSIDGALIIDEKCMCYGIGMIVDGKACTRGNPSRGSRYNSANNYVESMINEKHYCTGYVISEDGTLDIITTKQ